MDKVTKLEMIDVLRAEGWKQNFKLIKGVKRSVWFDPIKGDKMNIEEAYKIAHRRRRKRENDYNRKQKAKEASTPRWKGC